MIDGLMPYPAMKGSGVPWLGEVPAHWEVQRLCHVAEMRVSNIDKHTRDNELPVRLCNYVDVYKHDRIRSDMPFMRATATKSDIGRFRLLTGDVLITKDSEAWNDIGVPALVTDSADDLVSGYHLALLRPIPGRLTGEYLLRVLQSTALQYQFHVKANGVTRYGLAHAAIKSALLPIAPLAEQAAIARFLDHADRRIRRYIRAKKKMIKLLEEQKQAIIHRAVTRGLDPNVRVKPSGVEWLGDVPEHWSVRRLKTLCWMKSGESIAATSIEATGKYAVYGGNGIRGYTSKYTNDGNYVLVGRQGALCGNVHEARGRFWASEHAVVVKPRVGHDWLWLASLLRAMKLNQYSIAAAQPGLAVERILNLAVPAPPKEEQVRIAAHLESATAGLATSIACYRRGIDLLREFRTRLISDVVTGKLDVRDAAAALPEGGDEVEPADEVESESEDSEVDAEEAEQAPEETDA